MPNTERAALKKKEREKKSKEKVLRRREALRAEQKKKRLDEQAERAAEELRLGKPQPIYNDPEKLAQKIAARQAAKAGTVESKLAKNLEILKALEAEYDQEMANKQAVNEQLEAEGHVDIKSKMEALHKKALEIHGKAEEFAAALKNPKNKVKFPAPPAD